MPEMPAPAPQSPQAPTPARSRTPLIVGAAVGIVAVAAVVVLAVADPLHLRTPEPAPTAPAKVEASTDSSDSSASSDEGSSKDSPSADPAAADGSASQQDRQNSTQTDANKDPLVVPSADTGADGYILPKVDSHTYTKEELASLSQEDIRLASNEILARHGRKFKTASIRNYFLSKSWYDPRYEPAQYDSSSFPDPLNSYEHANYDLLMSLRTDR